MQFVFQAAFANGMSHSICQRNCSESFTDLVKTLPDKDIGDQLDIYYEQVSYNTACNANGQHKPLPVDAVTISDAQKGYSYFHGMEDTKKEILTDEALEKQEDSLDILTAIDIVTGGCLISKDSFIHTSQKEVLLINGCTAKSEVDSRLYLFKSRTISFVNNIVVFKDEPEDTSIPEYNEVFTIEQQPNNENYYHLLVEKITKLSLFVPLLKRNPQIAIHTAQKSEYYVYQFLRVFGLKNKIISGDAKARIGYVPHSGMCYQPVTAALQQSQEIFRQYIENQIRQKYSTIPQDTIVYIKRRKRTLHPEDTILTSLHMYAKVLNFEVVLFDDTKLPSLQDIMLLFHRAAVVIGPHGAGLANILFCQPGAVIVEVQCKGYWSRPCFRDMAFKLGLRYYATVSSDHTNGIQRDRCNKKGVWFDNEELSDILHVIFLTVLMT